MEEVGNLMVVEVAAWTFEVETGISQQVAEEVVVVAKHFVVHQFPWMVVEASTYIHWSVEVEAVAY